MQCPKCKETLEVKTSNKTQRRYVACSQSHYFRWYDTIATNYEHDSFCVSDNEEEEINSESSE